MSASRNFGSIFVITVFGLFVNSTSAVAQQQNSTTRQQQQQQPRRTGQQQPYQYQAPKPAAKPIRRMTPQEANQLSRLGAQREAAPVKPFELSARDQQYLESILDYWQQESERVKVYQCDFRRYMYDNAIVKEKDPKSGHLVAATIATGEIRYSHPGKASYQTTAIGKFAGPGKPYEEVKVEGAKEKWITDGTGIYEYDYATKSLYETILPPEMRGEGAVQNSPIPFLFGARKDEILKRYWVKVVTPPGTQNEYHLEAYPKTAADAQVYAKVQVILSREPMLPKSIHMYLAGYNPKQNDLRSVFISFDQAKANAGLDRMKNFFDAFVKPATPLGWKRVPRQVMKNAAAGAAPNNQRR